MVTSPHYTYQYLEQAWHESWSRGFTDYLHKHSGVTPNHNVEWWNQEVDFKLRWTNISKNKNLRVDLVKQYSQYPWNWYFVSLSIPITPTEYQNNQDVPWCQQGIQMNPCFNSNWYHLFSLDQLDWDYYSRNPSLSPETVIRHRHQPWNWDYVGLNPRITWKLSQEYHLPLTWWGLAKNPTMDWSVILRNPDKWWDISSHPKLTWRRVLDYEQVLRRQSQTAHWNYHQLSANPNITWEIVQNNPRRPWSPAGLSRNPNITWNIVINNLEYPWDWTNLSSHPNITWEIVRNNPNFPWQPAQVSVNPNLTWEIVQKFPDYPWDYHNLARNHMKFGKERWILTETRKIMATFQIQRHWRRCSCDLHYNLAKRKINLLYLE
jgi:hypothetical protein